MPIEITEIQQIFGFYRCCFYNLQANLSLQRSVATLQRNAVLDFFFLLIVFSNISNIKVCIKVRPISWNVIWYPHPKLSENKFRSDDELWRLIQNTHTVIASPRLTHTNRCDWRHARHMCHCEAGQVLRCGVKSECVHYQLYYLNQCNITRAPTITLYQYRIYAIVGWTRSRLGCLLLFRVRVARSGYCTLNGSIELIYTHMQARTSECTQREYLRASTRERVCIYYIGFCSRDVCVSEFVWVGTFFCL